MIRALTPSLASGCIDAVKWMALLLLVALECSCTTLANRRDLYSPAPASDSREMAKRLAGTTTKTTTTTTTTTKIPGDEVNPPPEFR